MGHRSADCISLGAHAESTSLICWLSYQSLNPVPYPRLDLSLRLNYIPGGESAGCDPSVEQIIGVAPQLLVLTVSRDFIGTSLVIEEQVYV